MRVKLPAVFRLHRCRLDTGQVFASPCDGLRLPRLKHRPARVGLSKEEARKVLNQPDLGKPYGLVDRAMLETLYSTGIRVREMESLTVHDIDFKNGLLTVRQGKGNKGRVARRSARPLAVAAGHG